MARKFQMALVLVVMTTCLLHDAASFCCQKEAAKRNPNVQVCADCEANEFCCATGSCNIFCCNCAGKCRKGNCWGVRRRRRDLLDMMTGNMSFAPEERSGHSIVREGDADGDGRMSIDEAHALMVRRGAPADIYRNKRDLHALDVNRDNYLSPIEIDSDAGYFTPA